MDNNLKKAMEIIEKANGIMERDGVTDEVKTLEKKLEKVTGKSQDIESFRHYSSVTTLEEIAKCALNPKPQKEDNLTDEKIREVILHLLEKSESEQCYWLNWLKINTGCSSDYIFYPDFVGLPREASLAQIADKVIEDWKKN